MVGVAQFGRALRCGRSGWEFKSPRSPSKIQKIRDRGFFVSYSPGRICSALFV